MTTKTKGGKTIYTYKGDLKKAIQSAEEELEKKKNSAERQCLKWAKEKAEKEYNRYEKRISDLTHFIRLAKESLEKTEGTAEKA